MPEHTPGPWNLIKLGNHVDYCDWEIDSDARDRWIARIQDEPDARLIAAAPDYHDTIKHRMDKDDEYARSRGFDKCGCEWCMELRPIVSKATGEK